MRGECWPLAAFYDYDPVKKKADIGSNFLKRECVRASAWHWGRTVMSFEQRSVADLRQDEYRILHEAELRDYLAEVPAVAVRLGGFHRSEPWRTSAP